MPVVIPAYSWQQEVFEALDNPDIEQIAAVGSRGPGKSWTSQHANVIRCLQHPGSEHIIFRRTSDDIVKQYAPQVRRLLDNFYGEKIPYNYNQTYKVFTIACPNGGTARLFLGFAESIKHAEKYMSFEYMTVTFDEVTHFEEEIPELICGSMRGSRNVKKLYFGNPGGVGHGWVKRKLVRPDTRDNKTLVLQPKLHENLDLMARDPGYADRLTRGLPEWKRRQWLDGDWEANEGAYFSLPPGAIREIEPPSWARWVAGVDGGYFPSAFAVLWAACWRDRKGFHHCHIYRCIKLRRLNLDVQAEAAKDVEAMLPAPISIRWADPATGKKNEGESDEVARTTARAWRRHGFVTQPAKRHSRVAGWMLFREMLAPIYNNPCYGPPGMEHGILTIDPSCMELITEIQDAQYETRAGQISGDDIGSKDDHCFVAGTMVTTLDGLKPIEQVMQGEMVLTRKGFRPVLKNWETPATPVYTVTLEDGTTLTGTGNHPVWVDGKSFVRLDALRCNDRVLMHKSSTVFARYVERLTVLTNTPAPELVPVRVVEVSPGGSSPVFNLTVGGEPEFFANGILVHNCLDAGRYVLKMVYGLDFAKYLPKPNNGLADQSLQGAV